MYILGVNYSGHDAAAALLDGGRVAAAVEEERLARIKHIDRFPLAAIRACLKMAGIGPADLDEVALYLDPAIYLRRLFSDSVRYFPRSARNFRRHLRRYLYWRGRRRAIPLEIGSSRARFHFVPHHLAHAAAGFFTSPFSEAAVLTVDGIGEWTTAALCRGQGNRITILKEFRTQDSLGHLYSFVTEYLGFKKNDGEGKVMGLAAFGQPRYLELFSGILRLSEAGYSVDSSWFNWDGGCYRHGRGGWVSERFLRALGPARAPGAPLEQRHRDIAASLQAALEGAMLHLAGILRRLTGLDDLVVSGGVALNSVINGLLLERTGFKRLYVPPAPGDAGTSLGAALYVAHAVLGEPRRPGRLSPFLGPEQGDDEVHRFLKDAGLPYRVVDDPADACAELLSQGAIVGWLQGRMEFGPRALGNRSILCDPVRPEMKDVLNLRVKHREPFRPYAPSIPEGRVRLYFDREHPSPYMSMTLPVRPERRPDFPAAIHVDGTARLQTVERALNPRYFEMIEAFGRRTGRYAVLNTSFNVQGEPIVCTAQDAVRCFYSTGMDHLFLGPFLLSKRAP
ncbi:MAG: hypothetical protein K6T75_05100 [Acetobacteraceae bacterium]|nr:hypothetical protein [Acetobacteraceae bacterium]